MTRRDFHSRTIGTTLAAALASPGQTPAASKIKIGQIGTRHAHAGGQLAALRSVADFEVVGVVEQDEARRRRARNDDAYAGLPWLTEEQLFKIPGLQAVAVETEVGGLLDWAEKVVHAGLHLHLDKPAGESLPQFRRILDTATRKQRLVKMGYVLRYNPAFQFMVRAVRQGWLGDIFSIHAEMSKKLSVAEREPMRRYAGGTMFELGCHLIDSVVRILGKPGAVTPFIRKGDDGFADNMVAVFDYPMATVTLRSAMIEIEGGARRQFVICGTKGSCEIRPLEGNVVKLTLDEPREGFRKGVQEITVDKAVRYQADWLDFAKAIRGETTWEFTPAHDLDVQETVLRASGMPLE
ncbi:MAG: Gfo/Idh/MocA family protein [Roseimicrobium sp.]